MWRRAWILKSVAVNLLSRLPFHEKLHFWGQKLFGKHELDADEMFRRASELFRLLRHTGGRVESARVLEIGTGWFPFVPLMARLLGARRVVTVDIHPWLSLGNVADTVAALGARLELVAALDDTARQELSRRYCRLQKQLGSADDARNFMERVNVEYMCPCDVTDGHFGRGAFDVALSSNLCEHVPPDILADIHRQTARMLSEDGRAVHRFNPGDHYKTFTGDPCNFLKFNDRTWRLLGGSGLSYHNRLRSPRHAGLAEDAGLNILLWADRLDSEARDRIEAGRLRLAPQFRGYTPAELAATYTWLVLSPGGDGKAGGYPLRGQTLERILQDDIRRSVRSEKFGKKAKKAAPADRS